MQIGNGQFLLGDCFDHMATLPDACIDMVLADPPYGDTSLAWDKLLRQWESECLRILKPTGSMWMFGSLRFFGKMWRDIEAAGWRYAQEIVWEKHNGSSFHADRFKRVHELAAQFVSTEAPWAKIYNDVQKTMDATPRATRRKKRPAHTGHIEAGHYISEDGGPRIMRSVIFERSCHGHAIHPTQKPHALIEILVRTSCPEGGLILDPFAGSGTTAIAAENLNRRWLCIEKDADYYRKATDRIAAHVFERDFA